MKATSILSLSLAIFVQQAGYALELVDTNADVAAFLKVTRERSRTEWLAAFETLESRYPEFYENVAFRKSADGYEVRRSKAIDQLFDKLPALQHGMEDLNARQREIVDSTSENFQRLIPDARLETTVYFLPGFSFNGKVQRLTLDAPKLSLFVGTDRTVEFKSDVAVLMAHELFHVHHFEQVAKMGKTFSVALWVEGLASYASGEIAGVQHLKEILMDSTLAAGCQNSETVHQWAQEFRAIAELSEEVPEADELYRIWFQMHEDQPVMRRGYCVGYHVAKRFAASGASLSEMAHLDYAAFHPRVMQILSEI